MLRNAADHIIAVDLARAALGYFGTNESVSAIQGNATRLPVRDSSVDAVCAFQLIEHLPSEGAVEILREIRRVLRPGGKGCITTPNARWRLRRGERPRNPFHVVDYWPEGVVKLCRTADIGVASIFGVVGRNGAQEIEKTRVKPRRTRGLAKGLRRTARSMGRKLTRGRLGTQPGNRATTQADIEKSWFTLSENYEEGLDFWIEISKQDVE